MYKDEQSPFKQFFCTDFSLKINRTSHLDRRYILSEKNYTLSESQPSEKILPKKLLNVNKLGNKGFLKQKLMIHQEKYDTTKISSKIPILAKTFLA